MDDIDSLPNDVSPSGGYGGGDVGYAADSLSPGGYSDSSVYGEAGYAVNPGNALFSWKSPVSVLIQPNTHHITTPELS